jgi:hypothetical protein
MVDANHIIAAIPGIMLLLWTVPAMYYDIRDREVPKNFWKPLWWVCLPTTAYLYAIGYYPGYLLIIGLIFTGGCLALLMMGAFMGADFWYMAAISLFLVQNPISGIYLMPISCAMLVLAAAICYGVLLNVPYVRKIIVGNKPEIPFLPVISAALVLAVVLTI